MGVVSLFEGVPGIEGFDHFGGEFGEEFGLVEAEDAGFVGDDATSVLVGGVLGEDDFLADEVALLEGAELDLLFVAHGDKNVLAN